jgi:hypothetical protein
MVLGGIVAEYPSTPFVPSLHTAILRVKENSRYGRFLVTVILGLAEAAFDQL